MKRTLTFGLGNMRAKELRARVLTRRERMVLLIPANDANLVMNQISALLGPSVRFEVRVRAYTDVRA